MSRNDIVESLLRGNERVIWQKKPVFKPFVLNSLGISLFGAAWLVIPTTMFVLLNNTPSNLSSYGKWGFDLFLVPFFLIGVALLSAPLYYMFAYRFTEYVLTDSRIILVSGLIGSDVKTLEFTRVVNMAVEVGLIDRLFSTGKIKFFTGEVQSNFSTKYDGFFSVSDPHETFKTIQDAMDSARLKSK